MKKTVGLTRAVNSSLFYSYGNFDLSRFIGYICLRCRVLGIINSLPVKDETLSLVGYKGEWLSPIKLEIELSIEVNLISSDCEKQISVFSAIVKSGRKEIFKARELTLQTGSKLMLERITSIINRVSSVGEAKNCLYDF